MNIRKPLLTILTLVFLIVQVEGFSPTITFTGTVNKILHKNNGAQSSIISRSMPLFMGRAAAVRAQTKGKTDAKKSKVNALYGKRIIMAVKNGGSTDPNANRELEKLIKEAKTNNVPVDNINRAIKRASDSDAANFAASTFEAYGQGGASMIINVLSDNPNRASADIKLAVKKNDGKMAETGSVMFMYDYKGKVTIEGVPDEEELLEAAIEAGCDEMELVDGDEEGTSIVYTGPKEVGIMMEAVGSLKFSSKGVIAHVSKAPLQVTDEEFEINMGIIDALEELDDVDSIEHNMLN